MRGTQCSSVDEIRVDEGERGALNGRHGKFGGDRLQRAPSTRETTKPTIFDLHQQVADIVSPLELELWNAELDEPTSQLVNVRWAFVGPRSRLRIHGCRLGRCRPLAVGQSIEFRFHNGGSGPARRTLALKVTRGLRDDIQFELRRGEHPGAQPSSQEC